MICCVEVRLTIPDNEARTALSTLRRLGVAVDRLERADLYRFDVETGEEERLVTALRGFETVYNPNKHALRVREEERPGAGEVWVDEIDGAELPSSGRTVRIGGRELPGVRSFERFTAWKLMNERGVPVPASVALAATDMLLCNPAFQKATRS
jgi:phosphoribosylformylglycinamidine (FGAM) synthase PurS component